MVANPNSVSVITATWQRPKPLSRCMASVHAQSHRPLEHVVVADGPDHEASGRVSPAIDTYSSPTYTLHYDQLVQHMTTAATGTGTDAFRRGCTLSTGDFLFFLPDDDLLVPTAIAKLLTACDDVDFSYSRVAMHGQDEPMTLESDWICGQEPPNFGSITNFLFRRELLDSSEYPYDAVAPDWLLIQQWMRSGKRWKFVPEVLQVHHYDPHMAP